MNFSADLSRYLNIDLSENQSSLFELYYKELIEYNKTTNLTRIVQKDEVFYKHFYDSLTLSLVINFHHITSICDMGSGAGFPGIPLKIIFPSIKLTIIDSLGKRIKFLEHLIQKLGLDDVHLVHDRIETFASKNQAAFDIVTARALGKLNYIAELGLPMTKIKGLFIAMKTNTYTTEIEEAREALKKLKSTIIQVKEFELPNHFGSRAHVVIQKNKHIDGFPRTHVQMQNKPL